MSEQTTPETESDEIIHYWARETHNHAACGLDILHTPYTFGSPEQAEVTCPYCKVAMPPAPVYRYAVKFVIVDRFGDVLWAGRATITQDKPRPEAEAEAAAFDVLNTSKTIRDSCPASAPEGRVIITAAFAI